MAYLCEGELDKELLVGCGAVVEIGLVAQVHGPVDEFGVAFGPAFGHGCTGLVVGFKEHYGRWVAGHHEVAHIVGQAVDEEMRVESAVAVLRIN